MAEKKERPLKIVADNRRARFNYEIGEVFEAGIMLTGTEVKSLRLGKATIAESYADTRDGELWLVNSNIPEYLQASRFNHAPKRPRKLLLHRRQINKLARGSVVSKHCAAKLPGSVVGGALRVFRGPPNANNTNPHTIRENLRARGGEWTD